MNYADLCYECYRSFTKEEQAQELKRLEDESFDLAEEISNKLGKYEQLREELKELLNDIDHNLSEIRSLPVEIQPPLYPLRDDLTRARNEVYSTLCQCEKYIKKLKGVTFAVHNQAIATLNVELCHTVPSSSKNKNPEKGTNNYINADEKLSRPRLYFNNLQEEGHKNPLPRWWSFIVMIGSLLLGVLLLSGTDFIVGNFKHVVFSEYLILPVMLFAMLYIAYFGIFGGLKILTVNHTCARQIILQTIGLLIPFVLTLVAALIEFASGGSVIIFYCIVTIPAIISVLIADVLKNWLCNTTWQRILLSITITIAMVGSIFVILFMTNDIEDMASVYHIGYILAFLIPIKLLLQQRFILGCFSFSIPFVFMCTAMALTQGGSAALIELLAFAAITFILIKFIPLIKIKKRK